MFEDNIYPNNCLINIKFDFIFLLFKDCNYIHYSQIKLSNFYLQKKFKSFANMISVGYSEYEYGNINIYRKETEFTAQVRFKFFVKSKDGKDYGA